MAELTPIPAEQRRAYYDALLAGRAEAARQGHHLIDDRIFIAFHRALYRPMLDAHEAEVRAKLSEEIAALAIAKPSEQWENGFQERGWNYAIQEATARVKRGHAANRPQIDAAAPTAHAEGHRTGEGSSGAQEAVG